MSISKIEDKLKLLTEELSTVDSIISDPIERNEHKRLLQKQIKKLIQTKDNLVKLQQEEVELESLRTDFLVAQHPQSIQNLPQEIQSQVRQEDNNNQIITDWDVPVTKVSEDWNEHSYTIVSDNSNSSKDPTQLPKKLSNSQTNHLVYLSKREIWISSVLAIFNFVFPYIYTRRWQPFCILLTVTVSIAIFISDESSLSTASWLSAIDNGIAIAKAKNKVKPKLS